MKPFRVIIIQCNERVNEINNLAKYLPSPFMKGGEYDKSYWAIQDKELSEYDICVATKYGLPTSMQDEMEDKYKVYISFPTNNGVTFC